MTNLQLQVIDYINKYDVFWLSDLRKHLGCESSDVYDLRNRAISHVVSLLKNRRLLQGEKVKGQRKYMRVRDVEIEDLSLSKEANAKFDKD